LANEKTPVSDSILDCDFFRHAESRFVGRSIYRSASFFSGVLACLNVQSLILGGTGRSVYFLSLLPDYDNYSPNSVEKNCLHHVFDKSLIPSLSRDSNGENKKDKFSTESDSVLDKPACRQAGSNSKDKKTNFSTESDSVLDRLTIKLVQGLER